MPVIRDTQAINHARHHLTAMETLTLQCNAPWLGPGYWEFYKPLAFCCFSKHCFKHNLPDFDVIQYLTLRETFKNPISLASEVMSAIL